MGVNILVADDQSVNRKIIKKVLESNIDHITFFDAADGYATVDLIKNQDIDLVILDLMMPGKDGFEVLREIKTDPLYKDIPIIIYTVIDSIDSINSALELGAYDYFTKPLTKEQVRVIVPLKVKNALRSYEQFKSLVTINESMKIELMLARMFQYNLMLENKTFSTAEMYGKYWPCEEISGDFYDCVQIGDVLWFIIADVSGHGTVAAMISSMVKMEFEYCIQTKDSPSEVLQQMNQTFCRITQGTYHITAFLGMIKGSMLQCSNAGHPYPLIYSPHENKVEYIEMNGFALGLFPDISYDNQSFQVNNGDFIFSYTDGFMESKFADNSFKKINEFGDYLRNYRELALKNPAELLNVIIQSFNHVTSSKARDDIAAMLINIKHNAKNRLNNL